MNKNEAVHFVVTPHAEHESLEGEREQVTGLERVALVLEINVLLPLVWTVKTVVVASPLGFAHVGTFQGGNVRQSTAFNEDELEEQRS